AYPSVTDDVYESLAIEKFLDGLRELETQQAVKLARPKTLNDALTQAMEFEAVRNSVRNHARIRAVNAESPVPCMEELVQKVLDALKTRRREIRCWSCGELGHPRNGVVNGRPRSLLLDTGATMTIVNLDAVQDKKKISSTTWALRTATGDSAHVYGETVASFQIGSYRLKHRILVANIDEDVILGNDIMVQYGFKVDLGRGVVTIGEEDVILRRGKDWSARVVLLEDTTLLPSSQVITKATVDRDIPTGEIMLLDTKEHNENLGRGIMVARTLFKIGKEFPARLMNVNGYPVTLKKGSVLGDCSTISSVVRRVQHSEAKCRSLPKELVSFVNDACQDLSPEQLGEVKKLLTEYQDVFDIGAGHRGRTDIVQHRIDTGDAKPIRQIPRRLPLAKREEADLIIKEMESDGIIEPSKSPWVSPVVLVKKKDGSSRFCVDFRQLNNVTKKDSYPLPRIDDTLDTLEGCQLFSTLDLKSGYWQVGLAPEDKEKTAFSIGTGLWQFTVMPFGLCNAPATFERLMDNVLRGLSWEICLVYLDDIIVLGKSFTHHLKNLEQVLRRLRAANLKLNPKKCNLFRKQVQYLGHVVSDKGVSVDPEKIRAITKWPVPRDKHEVRSFLGLCTYYRRFVKGFANVAKPLTKLTEEKRAFIWDRDCQEAFEELKRGLISAPILSYPRPEGQFVLDTDASNTAIGGVLSQLQNGEERVIGYFSKVLSKPERNYCVTRRELLAVVKSIEHFHKYLYGRRFLLRTDHAALVWLLRFKSPEGSHGNADALSRRPCEINCQHCSRQEEKAASVMRTTVVDDHWLNAELAKDQEEDPELKYILNWKTNQEERPSWQEVANLSRSVKAYWAQWNSIVVDAGLLKRVVENAEGNQKKLQLLVPKRRIPEVLRQLHDGVTGGHLGVHKTLEKARERFYWPNLKEDIKDWCRNCVVCAGANGPIRKKRAPMRQYNVGAPFERIAIDVAGPFPVTENGNKFILVVMDYFSKWVEAYALPNQEAVTIADVIVKELVSRFGVPNELHSDQGRNFESALFSRMCQTLGIRKTRTTALHPQSDGMVERMNRTMGKYLAKVVSEHQRDWDQYLHLFLLAYRSSINETTGQTPANVIFGREVRLPCDLQFGIRPNEDIAGEDYVATLRRRMDDIHERVRTNINAASDRMKERYDVKAEKGGYNPGELVWLYNPRRRRGYSPKLQRSWEGPYEVLTRINDVIYRIKQLPRGKPKIIHFNRLAPYHGNNGCQEEQQVLATVARSQGTLSSNEGTTAGNGTTRRSEVTTLAFKDLFTMPEDHALAHCVAEDLRMSRGIATVFRKKFGRTDELEGQTPQVGNTLHLKHGDQHLFYLVTKSQSQQRPTYQSLKNCLLSLREHLLNLGIKKLAIPRLGCGFDGLDWKIVRSLVEKIFRDSGVSIVVCIFNPWISKQARETLDSSSTQPTLQTVLGQNSLEEGAV
ncbi:hypothetical protein EPUL_005785, partial [Erysiphe pulchra]